jgi:hypothetical protein
LVHPWDSKAEEQERKARLTNTIMEALRCCCLGTFHVGGGGFEDPCVIVGQTPKNPPSQDDNHILHLKFAHPSTPRGSHQVRWGQRLNIAMSFLRFNSLPRENQDKICDAAIRRIPRAHLIVTTRIHSAFDSAEAAAWPRATDEIGRP